MDDPNRMIVEKKLEALESREPSVEYVLDGAAIGELGLIPCVLNSETDDSCSVMIADGPNTGSNVTVSKRHIVALGKGFFEDATKKLFK